MIYFCDDSRHLICFPYSIENLHKMAEELGINKCWFHNKKDKQHYDIPKKRITEIKAKSQIVSTQEIIQIIKEYNMTTPITIKKKSKKKPDKGDT